MRSSAKKTIWPSIYQRSLRSGAVVFDAVATVGRSQLWSRGHATPGAAIAAKEQLRQALKPGIGPPVYARPHGYAQTPTYRAWANMV